MIEFTENKKLRQQLFTHFTLLYNKDMHGAKIRSNSGSTKLIVELNPERIFGQNNKNKLIELYVFTTTKYICIMIHSTYYKYNLALASLILVRKSIPPTSYYNHITRLQKRLENSNLLNKSNRNNSYTLYFS